MQNYNRRLLACPANAKDAAPLRAGADTGTEWQHPLIGSGEWGRSNIALVYAPANSTTA